MVSLKRSLGAVEFASKSLSTDIQRFQGRARQRFPPRKSTCISISASRSTVLPRTTARDVSQSYDRDPATPDAYIPLSFRFPHEGSSSPSDRASEFIRRATTPPSSNYLLLTDILVFPTLPHSSFSLISVPVSLFLGYFQMMTYGWVPPGSMSVRQSTNQSTCPPVHEPPVRPLCSGAQGVTNRVCHGKVVLVFFHLVAEYSHIFIEILCTCHDKKHPQPPA